MQSEQDAQFERDVAKAIDRADMSEVEHLWFQRIMSSPGSFDEYLFKHILRTIQSETFLRLADAGGPLTIFGPFFDWLSTEQQELLAEAVSTVPFGTADRSVGWALLNLLGEHYKSTKVLPMFAAIAESPEPPARALVPYAVECHFFRSGENHVDRIDRTPFLQLLRRLEADPDAAVRSEAADSLQRLSK